MSTNSSHSLTTQTSGRGRPLRSCRPAGLLLLFSVAVLLAAVPVLEIGVKSTGALFVFACTAGVTSILAAFRFMTVLPDARVFRCLPATYCTLLMTIGSAALWINVIRAQSFETLLMGIQLLIATLIATVCTTMALAAAIDAHDLRRQQQRWRAKV